jgi:uncharacterized protein (DUF1697 family)
MNIYIALLRGINVGGNNILPMRDLVAVLEHLGSHNVRTYIQSGNAVFQNDEKDAARLSKKISGEIGTRHGFEPDVLLIGLDDFDRAIKQNPFPEAEAEPRTLHLGFLVSAPPDPDFKKLESLRKESERFRLMKNVFYLHAPEGIGRSKLAAAAEKLLGVSMTDRNWNTVLKISELAEDLV